MITRVFATAALWGTLTLCLPSVAPAAAQATRATFDTLRATALPGQSLNYAQVLQEARRRERMRSPWLKYGLPGDRHRRKLTGAAMSLPPPAWLASVMGEAVPDFVFMRFPLDRPPRGPRS